MKYWRHVIYIVVGERRTKFGQDLRAAMVKGGTLRPVNFIKSKDPVREALERAELTPSEYARSVMESFKAVCHLTSVNSLAKGTSQQQAEQLLQDAYNDCLETIATAPEQYNLDVAFWYILATKTAP